MIVETEAWDGTLLPRNVKFMCPKCLRVYDTDECEYCEDCNEKLFDIDTAMVDTIRLLNEKGYKTLFCCEGHCHRFKGESGLQEYDYKTPYITISLDDRKKYNYYSLFFNIPRVAILEINPDGMYYPYPDDENANEILNEFFKSDDNYTKVLGIYMNNYFDNSDCYEIRKGKYVIKKSAFDSRCKLFRKKIYEWAKNLPIIKTETEILEYIKNEIYKASQGISFKKKKKFINLG